MNVQQLGVYLFWYLHVDTVHTFVCSLCKKRGKRNVCNARHVFNACNECNQCTVYYGIYVMV